DGKRPSLTCATSAGKVLVHCPHAQRDLAQNDEVKARDQVPHSGMDDDRGTRFLSMNRKVTALAAGRLDEAADRDTLLVGMQTNLLAYDVDNNADVYYKASELTCEEYGVSSLLLGQLPASSQPLALVGGNCSIQGFDSAGAEKFWTVTGDKVSSMAMVDADGDGHMELLVGSDDFEMRVFRQEEVVSEITEADRVTHLECIAGKRGSTRWGFGLANGTIGVYDKGRRLWRVKTKHKV
ncbi:unnamed protein product, partial [Sphacelaria rigidula]